MPQPQLDNLVRAGQLKAESAAQAEINGLVRSGTVRLKDAGNTANSLESRFDLAYNAAHALSLAALRWHGYRSESRYIMFQSLTHTLKVPAEQWRVLNQAHRKRNQAEYEGDLDIDEALLAALIRVAREVANGVAALGPLNRGVVVNQRVHVVGQVWGQPCKRQLFLRHPIKRLAELFGSVPATISPPSRCTWTRWPFLHVPNQAIARMIVGEDRGLRICAITPPA